LNLYQFIEFLLIEFIFLV